MLVGIVEPCSIVFECVEIQSFLHFANKWALMLAVIASRDLDFHIKVAVNISLLVQTFEIVLLVLLQERRANVGVHFGL